MPRTGMTSGMLAAIVSGNVSPALFVSASFVTGPIYVWTGFGPISWNGFTWAGVGNIGSVSSIEESASVEAKGISLTFGGFDATLLTDVLTEFKLGSPVTVWLVLFAGTTIIPDPVVAWSGRMDQPVIDVDGTNATITIACENRMVDMNVAVNRRYTNDDQQLDYPGDRGMEFVTGIIEATIYWGAVPNSTNNK